MSRGPVYVILLLMIAGCELEVMSDGEVQARIELDQNAIGEGEFITANVVNAGIDTIYVATAQCSAGPHLPAYRTIETGIEKKSGNLWQPVTTVEDPCNNPVDHHRAVHRNNPVEYSKSYNWFNRHTELTDERTFRFSKRIKTSSESEDYSRITSNAFKVGLE